MEPSILRFIWTETAAVASPNNAKIIFPGKWRFMKMKEKWCGKCGYVLSAMVTVCTFSASIPGLESLSHKISCWSKGSSKLKAVCMSSEEMF